VVIDEDELLESVRAVYDAGKSAHAVNVRVELGDIADDGGYFDVMDVADDLAELGRSGNSRTLRLSTGAAVSRRL
jgi:hypothetical protein